MLCLHFSMNQDQASTDKSVYVLNVWPKLFVCESPSYEPLIIPQCGYIYQFVIVLKQANIKYAINYYPVRNVVVI